jgi:hypothetical protein
MSKKPEFRTRVIGKLKDLWQQDKMLKKPGRVVKRAIRSEKILDSLL